MLCVNAVTGSVAIRILHEVRCIQLYERCAALLRDLDHALKELQDKVMSVIHFVYDLLFALCAK